MTDFLKTESAGEEQWISVSDMMAGLMMIFLFISIIYIQNISKYFSEVADKSDEICHLYTWICGDKGVLFSIKIIFN